MTYQNFRGADLQEALSAVKATLGPNALIEGTRRVTNGREREALGWRGRINQKQGAVR